MRNKISLCFIFKLQCGMSNTKLLGGILLVVGTSIGGGMLALPVATAEAGIINTIFFLILCWLVMTIGALLILEVNLRLPPGSNMISMAKETLGRPGQLIAWVCYLFLLYTLLAGYISGGSDVFNDLLHRTHIYLPMGVTTLIFTLLLGLVVYRGIKAVDYINRGLMFGKLGVYLILVIIISPHMRQLEWHDGSLSAITASLMILIASFGFASIVPSLRDYFRDDVVSLRQTIIFGSFIPLCCYIIWEAIIVGTIHREGQEGLIALIHSTHTTSELTTALSHTVGSSWITGFFEFFTSICMLTAFLGVSLGLFDFLADGFKLKKSGWPGSVIFTLTFLPPLIIVLVKPGIYLQALRYAGICCVILMLLLPSLMAWQGREMAPHKKDVICVPGGTFVLVTIGLVGLLLLVVAWQSIGC